MYGSPSEGWDYLVQYDGVSLAALKVRLEVGGQTLEIGLGESLSVFASRDTPTLAQNTGFGL